MSSERFKNKKEADEIQIVNESYVRCLQNPDFFRLFYEDFMQHGPNIRAKFATTDMKHQMQALKHGLQYMIMFASGSKIAESKIEDLGITHDRNHRNITAELYDVWLESLLETIKAVDPMVNLKLLSAWRNVLMHGIFRMRSKF